MYIELPGATIDLRTTDVGMECADYSLLFLASDRDRWPAGIAEMMDAHWKTCHYHRSPRFFRSMIETYVTPQLERAALELVMKLVSPKERRGTCTR